MSQSLGCWRREANHQPRAHGRSCFGSETGSDAHEDVLCPNQLALGACVMDGPSMGCVFQAGEIGAWISFLFLFKIFVYFFFNFFFIQMIIALQCCAGFCHSTTLISHNYMYVYIRSLSASLPTPIPPLSVITECQAGLPGLYGSSPLASWQCIYVNATFSICPTFFPFNQGPASIFCTFYLKAILSIKMGALYII